MLRAKLFRNGSSQAVRLPKECRFAGDEVYVKRVGDGVLLLPIRGAWDDLRASLDQFTDDFLADREKLEPEEREPLD